MDISSRVWSCKIGETHTHNLPDGADAPMRQAVAEAYERLTGHRPDFIFSGWGDGLSPEERAEATHIRDART